MNEEKQNIWKKDIFAVFKNRGVNFKWFSKSLKRIAIALVVIAAIFTISDEASYYLGMGYYAEDYEDEYYDEGLVEENDGSCNVFGIELRGDMVTYITPDSFDYDGNLIYNETSSEDIVFAIADAENDSSVKMILLEVDSYGGSPAAAEEVMMALKQAKKPTVVQIRQSGLSAAYWSATGADTIFASENSDIGSIGVTMSYLDYSEQNKKEGIGYVQISSGKYKDAGDPDRALTEEEKNLFMRDTKIIHENFIKNVAENRNLDIDKVRELADGSSMLGEMALENGLIDRIGSFAEVKEYIKETIGEEVDICW